MSEDQLKSFLQAISTDQSLQEALKNATSPSEIVETAKEFGFPIELNGLQSLNTELSEEELEGISGGITISPAISPATPYILGVIVGGGAVAATVKLC